MQPRGPIHRVALHLAGPDPRIALREQPPDDALLARLERMGAWTYEYLQRSRDQPRLRAPDLAEPFGRERLDFKRDVRKLKELGLTVTETYRLARCGRSTRRSSTAGVAAAIRVTRIARPTAADAEAPRPPARRASSR